MNKRVVGIEENAEYLLNCNVQLNTDADISGAQPLLRSHTVYTPYLNLNQVNQLHHHGHSDLNDRENVLLTVNPQAAKLTRAGGGQSTTIQSAIPRHRRQQQQQEWNTLHWTSIFMHFQSVRRDHFMYPCVMIVGMVFIVAILFLQLLLVPPSTFVFCRFINWVLLLQFCYLFTFVVSHSKKSTKRWCVARDYFYVLFWVHSLIAMFAGLCMVLPFLRTHIAENMQYANCANEDADCTQYQQKYDMNTTALTALILIARCIPCVFCMAIATTFRHQFAFKTWYKDALLVLMSVVVYYVWCIISYVATHKKWQYHGMVRLNGNQQTTIMFCVLLAIISAASVAYFICYQMHRRCRCCQSNPFDVDRKELLAKMKEKERELADLPDQAESGIAL